MATVQRTSATVRLLAGDLRGRVDDGVASFKGIPYAAPPVGPLRWRAPQPPEPWHGTRVATGFGDDCAQPSSPLEHVRAATSEDCLHLNVWKPATARPGDGLPVLVWIHGGGYVGGGTSNPTYDGTAFAATGIVVVTVGYRLGRFGFFAHPSLFVAAEDPVGNLGLLDQVAALEWVRGNIEAFGGDAGRVTAMGACAGGASVLHLLTSPLVGDLFDQAVVLSGGGREPLLARPLSHARTPELAATSVDAGFARGLGIVGEGRDALAALREVDAGTLAGDDDLASLANIRLLGGPLSGVPIVDGRLVAGDPGDLLASGRSRLVPLLIGTTAVDVPLHFPHRRTDPLAWFGEDEPDARRAYGVTGHGPVAQRDLLSLLLSVGADLTMHEPAHHVAATVRAAGLPAWTYRFTYTATSTRPAQRAQVHGGELPFLFNTLDARFGDAVSSDDLAVADAFQSYVSCFVREGDPNGAGLPWWPQAEPGAYAVLDMTPGDGPVYGADPRAGRAARCPGPLASPHLGRVMRGRAHGGTVAAVAEPLDESMVRAEGLLATLDGELEPGTAGEVVRTAHSLADALAGRGLVEAGRAAAALEILLADGHAGPSLGEAHALAEELRLAIAEER